jgi:hypothetical protein
MGYRDVPPHQSDYNYKHNRKGRPVPKQREAQAEYITCVVGMRVYFFVLVGAGGVDRPMHVKV